MTLGERLQELRRKTGMSQDALAEKLEVSRQAVSKWERDEAMPETEKVIRIARLFDISLDELLLGECGRQEAHTTQNAVYTDVKRTIKRHGYKTGYALIVWGLLICTVSLVLWLVWPSIGMDMMLPEKQEATPDFENPYLGKSYTIIVGGEERVVTDIPDFLIEKAREEQGITQAENTIAAVLEERLRAQARLCLIGLIPGAVLTAGGSVIVGKGRKKAKNEQ